MPESPPRILIVAGSDSGGGAGIQADIKTVAAFGGYAMTAVTAITVQNTLGVTAVHPVPVDIVRGQIDAVLSDLRADAIKTGMLGDAALIEAVADALARQAAGIPLVVDPVMVAKGGARLLPAAAERALVERLLPLATLLTPNIPEAEALTGRRIAGVAEMRLAARDLLEKGAHAVLLKGGHLEGARLFDLLLSPDGETVFESERIDTRHTHGTGCTLASAVAMGLGQGMPLPHAVARARDYVRRAILAAPGFGAGHGPLWHGVEPCVESPPPGIT